MTVFAVRASDGVTPMIPIQLGPITRTSFSRGRDHFVLKGSAFGSHFREIGGEDAGDRGPGLAAIADDTGHGSGRRHD